MPLDILLASFILAAIRVSFENMSMKVYLDLQDSSMLTMWSKKRNICLGTLNRLIKNGDVTNYK